MTPIPRHDDAARRYLEQETFNPLRWEEELPPTSPGARAEIRRRVSGPG